MKFHLSPGVKYNGLVIGSGINSISDDPNIYQIERNVEIENNEGPFIASITYKEIEYIDCSKVMVDFINDET